MTSQPATPQTAQRPPTATAAHADLSRARQLVERWIEEDEVTALAARVGGSDETWLDLCAGRRCPTESEPLSPDDLFLIASPTKPLVAMAVVQLAERGELMLGQRVARFVPEFAAAGKRPITILHCLTHTSGLPDQLPQNEQLRSQHAGLDVFVRETCQIEPSFRAGCGVEYQSMGYLMLGEVVRRASGRSLPEYLRDEIFAPLGMQRSYLGIDVAASGRRFVDVRVPPERDSDWGWNSDYWRSLGAPWGGLLTTADDLQRLCRHLLAIHRGEPGVVSPAALAAMTSNRLAHFPELPEPSRRTTPWGLGWQPNWPHHPRTFGELLPAGAYGHWGATGTLIWIDPGSQRYAVLLSNEPIETANRRLARLTNVIMGGFAGG